MQYIKNSETVEVKDYPYGFRLRTTLFDSVEFNPKKGYRHVTQTINPKTGLRNKPKASTYSPFILRGYDDKGHIKALHYQFYGIEGIIKCNQFISDNFELLDEKEVSYLLNELIFRCAVELKSYVTYCNSDFEALKPLFIPQIDLLKAGLKELNVNTFAKISFDVTAIEGTKDKDFQPFKIKSYGTI